MLRLVNGFSICIATAGPHDSFFLLSLVFLCELYKKTAPFSITLALMGKHGEEALLRTMVKGATFSNRL